MWRSLRQCPLPMVAQLVLISLLSLLPACATREWDTEFEKRFTFECESGSFLSKLYSEHDNKVEDRRWQFGCTEVPDSAWKNCYWEVSEWDYLMSNLCDQNGVATGIKSYHKVVLDRTYDVLCCEFEGYETYDCTEGPSLPANYFDWPLDFNVSTFGSDYVLWGLRSHFAKGLNDREFWPATCKFRKL